MTGDVLCGVVCLDLPADVETGQAVAFALEHDVEEEHLGTRRPDLIERPAGGLRLVDAPALRRQGDPDHLADELMVVCDEDVGHIGGEQPNFVVVSFTGLGARP